MPRSIKHKPTIKDIQTLTGLSLGCISKFLNGGNVTQENKIKLEAAIKEVGYKVDIYARGMITGQTKSVGLIIPELSNTFYGILSSSISKNLMNVGYDVIVNEHYDDADLEKNIISKMLSRRVDAIILVPASNKKEDYSDVDINKIVFLDGFVDGLDADFVLVNNKEISTEVVKYLYKAGHTRIAAVISDNTFTGNERRKGFIEGCKQCNIDYSDLIFTYQNNVNNAYDVIEKIMQSGKYTAIFASNYIATLGAIFYLNEKNYNVPFDISVVGFDNIMLTKLFKPQLTIVSQPMEEIAEKCVERTLELIRGNKQKRTTDVLSCKLERGHTVEIEF